MAVDYAPSHQSAVYALDFEQPGTAYLVFNSRNGALKAQGKSVSGYQYVDRKTKVYLYAEVDAEPAQQGVLTADGVQFGQTSAEGKDAAVVLAFGDKAGRIGVRYGISFIDEAQAQKNMEREIKSFDVAAVAETARQCWNEALGKIHI